MMIMLPEVNMYKQLTNSGLVLSNITSTLLLLISWADMMSNPKVGCAGTVSSQFIRLKLFHSWLKITYVYLRIFIDAKVARGAGPQCVCIVEAFAVLFAVVLLTTLRGDVQSCCPFRVRA